jgi:MFS transporter, MHS family, proline/betaine transporter
MGALGPAAASGGILLGSAVGAGFAASMPADALDAWGWRLPFVCGLVVGVVGYFLRRYVSDVALPERRERAPVVETLRDHWRSVSGFAGLSVFIAVGFYLSFVYLVSWLQTADGIPPARALEINSISMVLLVPATVASGLASDRFGRRPFMLFAAALGIVGALPVFWLLDHPSALYAQMGQLCLVPMVGLYNGVLPTVLVEAAPPQVRCTAVALGYSICMGVIGGLTPLAAAWLVERTGHEVAPAFLMIAAGIIAFATVLRSGETYRTPFEAKSASGHPPIVFERAKP